MPQQPYAGRGGYTGSTYGQAGRNSGRPQPAYGQPQGNGYGPAQRGLPQGSGYGHGNGYGQPNGYGQASGYAQRGTTPQNGPAQPSVPNRNANYNGMNQQPARQSPQQSFWRQQPNGMGPNSTRGEHLQQWMQQHNSLTTQDQQRALQREPGFNQLPQQTQQRMLDRLQRLNSMPPKQRERTLQRSEQMERLSPVQRGEVRSAMGELGALSQDRRRAVARTFRELRPMSPDQRNQFLNSPAFRQQFNDQERGTLENLLTVSPMLPQQ